MRLLKMETNEFKDYVINHGIPNKYGYVIHIKDIDTNDVDIWEETDVFYYNNHYYYCPTPIPVSLIELPLLLNLYYYYEDSDNLLYLINDGEGDFILSDRDWDICVKGPDINKVIIQFCKETNEYNKNKGYGGYYECFDFDN